MKKIGLILFCVLSFVFVKAQAPCAVFYTELGERFTVYIDGIAQHQYSEPNVKILDISGLSHNVRITFENGFIEDVNKSINLANGTESSFMIHKKQGRYDLSPKNQIPLTQASRSANTNAQQVVIFKGSNNVTTTTTTSNNSGYNDGSNTNVGINMGVTGDGGSINMNVSVSDNSGNSANGTVTTSVGVSSSGGGKKDVAAGHAKDGGGGKKDVAAGHAKDGTVTTSVGVSSSGGGKKDVAAGHAKDGGGVKTSVSASGNTSSNSKPTTTTTNVNFSGNINPANNVQLKPVVAGYNGRIGCSNPMTADAFAKAKESILSKNFASAQLTVAKQIIDANCLLVSQIKELVKIFDFEESKLEFAKYAYKHACDLDNYYQVNDAFDFEGSVTKLDEYIKSVK